jgi:hypothetical protein
VAPRLGRCKWQTIQSFKMKSGFRSCTSAAASSSVSAINRHKITHTFTSTWAMPMKLSALIVLRYSVSIRAWVQMKPIHQIVPTKRRTEKDRVSHRLDAMSVQGQKQTFHDVRAMSALPPKADIGLREKKECPLTANNGNEKGRQLRRPQYATRTLHTLNATNSPLSLLCIEPMAVL